MRCRRSSERPGSGGRAAGNPVTGARARSGESGTVTAETAVLLPGLAGLLALLLGVLGHGLDHVRATDAARSAARLVARGEALGPVRDSALREAPPGARLDIDTVDDLVVVTVTAPGRSLLPGLRLPDVQVEAVVAEEQSGSGGFP